MLFAEDARPLTIAFLIVLELNVYWLHFSPLLSRVLGRQFAPTPPFVFFFCWPSISAQKFVIARYVIKTIIYGVWYFRNKTTFRGIKDNHRAILRFSSFDISSRVRIDFHCLTSSRFLMARNFEHLSPHFMFGFTA